MIALDPYMVTSLVILFCLMFLVGIHACQWVYLAKREQDEYDAWKADMDHTWSDPDSDPMGDYQTAIERYREDDPC